MIFGIKEKIIILTHIIAIVTNIPVLLKTGFVVQGHIYSLLAYAFIVQMAICHSLYRQKYWVAPF